MRQDGDLVRQVQDVLGADADRLAGRHGRSRRAGELSGGAFARTRVVSFLRNPDATPDPMAQTAALDALAPEDRGFRGAAAGMRGQVRFELTADLVSGSSPVRDLGYDDRSVSRAIGAAGAYFPTRFRQPTAAFDTSGARIPDAAGWPAGTGARAVEARVGLGTGDRLPCGSIAIPATDGVRGRSGSCARCAPNCWPR